MKLAGRSHVRTGLERIAARASVHESHRFDLLSALSILALLIGSGSAARVAPSAARAASAYEPSAQLPAASSSSESLPAGPEVWSPPLEPDRIAAPGSSAAGLHPAGSVPLVALAPADTDAIVYRESFDHASPATGLPQGWGIGPPEYLPWIKTSADTTVYGAARPSLRVDLSLAPANFQVTTAFFTIPDINARYTVDVSLRIQEPDASMRVQVVVCDYRQYWLETIPLMDVTGAQMSGFRRYRLSFRHQDKPVWGTCFLMFGLPYRKFLRSGTFWIDDLEVHTGAEAKKLELYLRPLTVEPGQPVEVHASCGQGQADLRVYREGLERDLVLGPIPVTGLAEQPVPAGACSTGCGWPASTLIPVGSDWKSGVYIAQIDDGDRPVDASFVVRGHGGNGSILVELPTHTDQAYNGWGGGSFYSHPEVFTISFERPMDAWLDCLYAAPIYLIRWLEREGIPYEVANDDDLNDRPDLLFRYPGLVLCWHSEYWTRNMREGLERYLAAGGSIISLAGNTCWWQTRMESCDPVAPPGCTGSRRLTCYKTRYGIDPYLHKDPSGVTTNWDSPPVDDPPQRLFGLDYRYGGMVNWSTSSSCPGDCHYDWVTGSGGYTAYNTRSWVFAGTGLTDGQTFGQDQAIVGYEVDGAPLVWTSNAPPTIRPGFQAPADFQVLGYAPCTNLNAADSSGVAVAGLSDRGRSFLFDGGTTNWCWGLEADPIVQKITRNLIDHLSSTPPAQTNWLNLTIIPNPVTSGLVVHMTGRLPEGVGVYGPDGRELAWLKTELLDATTGAVRWDLNDSHGRALPSGVYWIRAPGAEPRVFVHVR